MNYDDKEKQQEYGVVFDIFGIYIDWQIDHNIFPSKWKMKEPHNINCFEDLYGKTSWQVAKTRLAGREILFIDLDLKYFSYSNMASLRKTVLEDHIAGCDIRQRLRYHSEKTGLETLNQVQYYLNVNNIDLNGTPSLEIVYRDPVTKNIFSFIPSDKK